MKEPKKRSTPKATPATVPALRPEPGDGVPAFTDLEHADLIARVRQFPTRPTARVVMSEDGARAHVELVEGDANTFALAVAAGSGSPDFLSKIMTDVSRVVPELTDTNINAAFALLASIAPTNEAEALLSAQMIAAHEGAQRCTQKMLNTADPQRMQTYGGLANKFMRTFAVQMEALAKLRRGGEQIVKHVHVYEGGQAVVAGTINQHQGGGGQSKDGG